MDDELDSPDESEEQRWLNDALAAYNSAAAGVPVRAATSGMTEASWRAWQRRLREQNIPVTPEGLAKAERDVRRNLLLDVIDVLRQYAERQS